MVQGLTDYRGIYQAPEVKITPRVVALLECWAAWRDSVRRVLLRHMQPRCTLGRLVRLARQEGELWEHNRTQEVFDEVLMSEVDQLVAGMNRDLRDVLMLAYVNGRNMPSRQRAKRLKCSQRTYFYRINEAHEYVDKAIDWSKIQHRI